MLENETGQETKRRLREEKRRAKEEEAKAQQDQDAKKATRVRVGGRVRGRARVKQQAQDSKKADRAQLKFVQLTHNLDPTV